MSNDTKKTPQSKDYKRGYDAGVNRGMLYGAMTFVGGFILTAVIRNTIK